MKTRRTVDLLVQILLWIWAVTIVESVGDLLDGRLLNSGAGLAWYIVAGGWQVGSHCFFTLRDRPRNSVARRVYGWLLALPILLVFFPFGGWEILGLIAPYMAACYTFLCLYELLSDAEQRPACRRRSC